MPSSSYYRAKDTIILQRIRMSLTGRFGNLSDSRKTLRSFFDTFTNGCIQCLSNQVRVRSAPLLRSVDFPARRDLPDRGSNRLRG